jgi:hypothetical protein
MATGTLVDSNVLLDIMTDDPNWSPWASEALAEAFERGPVMINPIIYAEVSIRFSSVEELEDVLPSQAFLRESIPWAAAFLAGKAFLRYRRNGGVRRTTLPDFFIGAHAAVHRLTLLTRDAGRFHTYFPTVTLATPGS